MNENYFIGEIRLFPYTYAPDGWLFCNGAVLLISQFTPLFSIISTIYGGDATRTFQLPNLQGFVVQGLNPAAADHLGETFGTPTVNLTYSEMPYHDHALQGTKDASTTNVPDPTMFPALSGKVEGINPFVYGKGTAGSFPTPKVEMNPGVVGVAGSSTAPAHSNIQPYLAMNYCICYDGTYPIFQ